MLFDTKIQKHDITYTYEDPKMVNYLEEILEINDKYQNKIIELKENMNIIRKKSIEKQEYQFYAECVYKHFRDITEEICNLSEDINSVYDRFLDSYSTLSESESNVLDNMLNIVQENLYFNGYLYDLTLDNVNLTEDVLNLDEIIYNNRDLQYYIESVNDTNHYNNIRSRILNKKVDDNFQDLLYESMLLNNGRQYNARLTKDEKENLLEALLNTEMIRDNANQVINSINDHYCNVIDYFNEMSNLKLTNVDNCVKQHILVEAKLTECINVLSIYNEVLGVYLDTVNKQNREYNDFFNQIL